MVDRSEKSDPIVLSIIFLILFLCVGIVATLFLQQQSVVEVVAQPQVENALLITSSVQTKPEEVAEVAVQTQPEIVEVNPEGLETYITIVDSCGPHFEGECLRVRSGPGLDYPVVTTLRTGIVLKVAGSEMGDGREWYKVTFDEWLRYPERVSGQWYVAADFVEPVYDAGIVTTILEVATGTPKKTITVDRSEQKLYAYQGEELFMEESISTGIELTPTPRGVFTVFRKTPSRYMQGPLPYLAISKYYDLPGVPWNLYFTEQGAVIHGTYWHDSFGQPYSSGCVNVEPQMAQKLYAWAEIGTTVIVQD